MKEVAALALGEIGDPRAVEPLITALGDQDYEVRSTVSNRFRAGEKGPQREPTNSCPGKPVKV